MVVHHWSDDGMVMYHHRSLVSIIHYALLCIIMQICRRVNACVHYTGPSYLKIKNIKVSIRLRRWSIFYSDGMVMFFFQGTIAIDGFSMVLPSLDVYHWMFFYRSTIDINGFLMVFSNSGAMVSDGFDLQKNLKMRVIFFLKRTLLLVNFRCKWTLKDSIFKIWNLKILCLVDI